MNNTVLFLIIVCLCAIIPAGVCFIAVWARQMADGRRIERALDAAESVKNIEHSYERMQASYYDMEKKVTTLGESFQNLTNKINSRQKVEENARRRREKEEEEQAPPIDGQPSMEEMQQQYPWMFAPQQPDNGGTPQPVRPMKRVVVRQHHR